MIICLYPVNLNGVSEDEDVTVEPAANGYNHTSGIDFLHTEISVERTKFYSLKMITTVRVDSPAAQVEILIPAAFEDRDEDSLDGAGPTTAMEIQIAEEDSSLNQQMIQSTDYRYIWLEIVLSALNLLNGLTAYLLD